MSFASPSLAVAIPTKNRPDDLEITIESVLSQTVLPMQLIVIDQSADDESQYRVKALFDALPPEVQRCLALVYVRDSSIIGLTAARNRALKAVNAEIVLFLDDDVILEHDFNEHILEAYNAHPEAVGISGIITNYSPLPAAFRYWSRIFARGPFRDERQPIYWKASRIREDVPLRVTRLGGGLMSFSVAAIKAVAFDENLQGACDGEDVEFCSRLWPRPLFIAPKAGLVHRQTPRNRSEEHWLPKQARTNWYLYRRNWNYGIRNRVCFIWLNLGYALVAVLVSMRQLSAVSLASLLRAIRDSRGLVDLRRGGS